MPISYERWRIITFTKIIGATFLLSSTLLLRMFWIGKEINVRQHEIQLGKRNSEQKKMTVFFITDVHCRKIDHRLVKKITKEIDVVIIGGDFAERNVPLCRINQNIKTLSELGPVFFVWGNNDREVGEDALREIMERHQVKILDNENRFVPGHSSWGICGTDDSSGRIDIKQSLNEIDRYQHVLFVSHQPGVWKQIERVFKPTMMLAGHTHGGQIRFGKYGIGDPGYFYWSGEHGKLISNGYGTTSIPFRLGAHPESHLITINYTDEH